VVDYGEAGVVMTHEILSRRVCAVAGQGQAALDCPQESHGIVVEQDLGPGGVIVVHFEDLYMTWISLALRNCNVVPLFEAVTRIEIEKKKTQRAFLPSRRMVRSVRLEPLMPKPTPVPCHSWPHSWSSIILLSNSGPARATVLSKIRC
jgi:hypothetical protein